MVYLFIKDISYTFKKNYKLIFGYILAIFLFLIPFYLTSEIKNNSKFVYQVLGFTLTINNFNILEWIFYIIKFCLFIVVFFNIIINDLNNGLENIFLRIKPIMWMINKILTIFILNVLLNLIIFIFNYFLIKEFNFYLFLKNLFHITNIQILFISCYLIFKSNIKKFVISCIFFIFYILFNYNVFYVELYKYIYNCIIILCLLLMFQRNLSINDLKE